MGRAHKPHGPCCHGGRNGCRPSGSSGRPVTSSILARASRRCGCRAASSPQRRWSVAYGDPPHRGRGGRHTQRPVSPVGPEGVEPREASSRPLHRDAVSASGDITPRATQCLPAREPGVKKRRVPSRAASSSFPGRFSPLREPTVEAASRERVRQRKRAVPPGVELSSADRAPEVEDLQRRQPHAEEGHQEGPGQRVPQGEIALLRDESEPHAQGGGDTQDGPPPPVGAPERVDGLVRTLEHAPNIAHTGGLGERSTES